MSNTRDNSATISLGDFLRSESQVGQRGPAQQVQRGAQRPFPGRSDPPRGSDVRQVADQRGSDGPPAAARAEGPIEQPWQMAPKPRRARGAHTEAA